MLLFIHRISLKTTVDWIDWHLLSMYSWHFLWIHIIVIRINFFNLNRAFLLIGKAQIYWNPFFAFTWQILPSSLHININLWTLRFIFLFQINFISVCNSSIQQSLSLRLNVNLLLILLRLDNNCLKLSLWALYNSSFNEHFPFFFCQIFNTF